MTQYLMSVHYVEGVPMPPEDEMQASYEATGRFNEELKAEGHWVFAGGLTEPQHATVVDNTGAKAPEPIVTDGPFAESKEHIAGFWVIEAADLDEALGLAKRASAACVGPVEVRRFHDERDF